MTSITAASIGLIALELVGCTGQLPGSFRLKQEEELFSAQQDVNTKLDILWVVDNSGSMDEEQAKLREGFSSFASRYMKPTWDIHLAVITTDTYLANPAFQGTLGAVFNSTKNYNSNYVNGISSSGIPGRVNKLDNPNPSWNPNLFVWDAPSSRWKTRAAGFSNADIRPNYSANWAKLLDADPVTGKGNHDGPPVLICSEINALSGVAALTGLTKCETRDNIARTNPTANTGSSNCAMPGTGEAAVSQCVNTVQNDTVHSGKSIISTYGANADQLVDDFLVNATVGIQGYGIESGINSMFQLMLDNEAPTSTTKFFRQNSLRVIVFVSDEDDASYVLPTDNGVTQFTPDSYITSCQKSQDGTNYWSSNCIKTNQVYPAVGAAIPISVVKDRMDTFFRTLDGNTDGDPNYFVATITALTAASVLSSGDQASRNLELGRAVGKGSLALEINSADYSPLLDAIGTVIVQKKAIFEITRVPTGAEDMLVYVQHANGTKTLIPSSKFVIDGKTLTITDDDVVLGFVEGDRILINYQPKSVE